MLYNNELSLSDSKVKIKNLKEILRHENIPFQNSAKHEELQTLVLNIPEMKIKKSFASPHSIPEIAMKTPPSVKDSPGFIKRLSGTTKASADYTPERHPPKKFKRFFSPLKNSSIKKK